MELSLEPLVSEFGDKTILIAQVTSENRSRADRFGWKSRRSYGFLWNGRRIWGSWLRQREVRKLLAIDGNPQAGPGFWTPFAPSSCAFARQSEIIKPWFAASIFTGSDGHFSLTVFAAENGIQSPQNSFDQLAQDQRQRVSPGAIAALVQHTCISSHTLSHYQSLCCAKISSTTYAQAASVRRYSRNATTRKPSASELGRKGGHFEDLLRHQH